MATVTGFEAPHITRQYIQAYHESNQLVDSAEIDLRIFGIDSVGADRQIADRFPSIEDDYFRYLSWKDGFKAKYERENLWFPGKDHIWTPYNTIRGIVRALNLAAPAVLYDLGAGYGRLPVYAGITTDATCKGIELMPERVTVTRAAIERLELEHVEMIEGNVLDQDLDEGDIFFMYLPFSHQTFTQVIRQLKEVATEKTIQIVARGGASLFEAEEWLEPTSTIQPSGIRNNVRTRLFKSQS